MHKYSDRRQHVQLAVGLPGGRHREGPFDGRAPARRYGRCEADGSLMCRAGLVISYAPVAGPASSWPGRGRVGGGNIIGVVWRRNRRPVLVGLGSRITQPRWRPLAQAACSSRLSWPDVDRRGHLSAPAGGLIRAGHGEPLCHPPHREGVPGHLVEQPLDLILRPVPGGSAWQAFLMRHRGISE